ncbi:phenylalanine--tRNA ligase beta subunit [Longispora fulva]|uniref:Phenylalanine--tRNA ligase beta subunit n=1 Tax=Longispora fulva TaxID=619741 RepID=A0A8J7KKZ9_9ACTN|nr:phenylalanine--tRNA ligase subunit beta [Longispora fulva]MBG6141870.1 phenylalanyl-tRNA synthetase beta chain [Longispora fulva]GIG58974.1 phenylalanine--tRNA ligase beta subunit [Longispora fulva]
MRISLSWLREHADIPAGITADELEKALVSVGLEVEELSDLGAAVQGPLVVARVLSIEELTEFKKPIRYCMVDVGEAEPTSVICGARNFAEGDLVVLIRPGGVLPGDFHVGARKTYGRMSHGMICSARELGLGDDHDGIIILSPDLADRIGQDARPLVGLDEVVVELAITPDRGYCFSARGIARELAGALGVDYRDPALLPAPGARGVPVSVTVRDTVGCDRFGTRVVRGVDPTRPSPAWLTARLTHAGVRPISLAVDITNYVMMDLGQPMHAFDADRVSGGLVVRRAEPGETLTTLDGAVRKLDAEDLVISDDSGVISLAAIMGGASTEVSGETVNVLFEAAHWDPVTVARAARRHKLPSEASKRFERGVDPKLPLVAIQRAVSLLVEYGGGVPDDAIGDVDHVAPRAPITMAADLPNRISGVDYTRAAVVRLLEQVGCSVEDSSALRVVPPTWRPDLTDPADLAEEVIRLHGYDQVASILPSAPPGGRGLSAEQRRRRSVGRTLAEAGYVEVHNYPFVGAEFAEAFGLADDDPRRVAVGLRNPISDEEPLLRTTMLPPLLAALTRNLGRGNRDLALFEVGRVFHPSAAAGNESPELGVAGRPTAEELAAVDALLPAQPWRVAAVLAGEIEPAGWWGKGRTADWADAVEAARIVVDAAGAHVTVRAAQYAPWHPGRCAALLVGDVVVGHAGELHPAVCAALDLPKRTCAMELELDALPLPGAPGAPTVSTYPPALIDVALVVDAAVPAADLGDALAEGAGSLLESLRLFDVFESEQLGAGRKSLAYKLTLRALDRTLTGEESVAVRDAAVAEAVRRHGAVLRGA